LETQKDKWLFFLKNLESFEDIPAILREPVFEKAYATAEYVNYPPALQEAYQNDLKAYRDNVNVLETARIEGEAIGEAKGEAQKALEIARSMKSEGCDSGFISKMTGLSSAEIERLG
jgi:predicted transposase/invertase (TIGR01784 family)